MSRQACGPEARHPWPSGTDSRYDAGSAHGLAGPCPAGAQGGRGEGGPLRLNRPGFGPEDVAAATGVSRETLTRLEGFAGLLGKWQRSINLVAAGTLPELWRRHMLDSAALFPLIPAGARTLVDLGSGAGFPGLVLAIMGVPE